MSNKFIPKCDPKTGECLEDGEGDNCTPDCIYHINCDIYFANETENLGRGPSKAAKRWLV